MWEGGYVFAFKQKPNGYAIKNSGAHLGVVISFQTSAMFVEDLGIMDIHSIKIQIDGYISCRSSFYYVEDVVESKTFNFSKGLNKLVGEIDSGIFGISYLISMYDKINKKTVFSEPIAYVNDSAIPLQELSKYSCYLDESNRLFSSKKTARRLITEGLQNSKLPYSPDEICELFKISDFRFNRCINAMGNERYKAMAAIGFCHEKQIFCFPWFSAKRYNCFKIHMTHIIDTLSELGKIIILPTGYEIVG